MERSGVDDEVLREKNMKIFCAFESLKNASVNGWEVVIEALSPYLHLMFAIELAIIVLWIFYGR